MLSRSYLNFKAKNFKAKLGSSGTGTDRLADQPGTITKGSENFNDEVPVVINLFGSKLSFSIMKYSKTENEKTLYLESELSSGN